MSVGALLIAWYVIGTDFVLKNWPGLKLIREGGGW